MVIKTHNSSARSVIVRGIQTLIFFTKHIVYYSYLSKSIQAQQTPLIVNGSETTRDDTKATTTTAQLWNVSLPLSPPVRHQHSSAFCASNFRAFPIFAESNGKQRHTAGRAKFLLLPKAHTRFIFH